MNGIMARFGGRKTDGEPRVLAPNKDGVPMYRVKCNYDGRGVSRYWEFHAPDYPDAASVTVRQDKGLPVLYLSGKRYETAEDALGEALARLANNVLDAKEAEEQAEAMNRLVIEKDACYAEDNQ